MAYVGHRAPSTLSARGAFSHEGMVRKACNMNHGAQSEDSEKEHRENGVSRKLYFVSSQGTVRNCIPTTSTECHTTGTLTEHKRPLTLKMGQIQSKALELQTVRKKWRERKGGHR